MRGFTQDLLRGNFLLVQRCLRSWLLLILLLIWKFLAQGLSMWLGAWIVGWRNICDSRWLNFSVKAFIKVWALYLSYRFNFFVIKLNLVGLLRSCSSISINLLLEYSCCILNQLSMSLRRFTLWCRLSWLWVMLREAVGSHVITSTYKVLLQYGAIVRLLLRRWLDVARLEWLALLLNCFYLCRHFCLNYSNFYCQLVNSTILNLHSSINLRPDLIFQLF